MKYSWVYKEKDRELQGIISRELAVSPILAQLLINRGITDPSSAHKFIRPFLKDLYDPFLMKDMEKSVNRIIRAIKAKERILIYGDYDVDGITTTALFINFFRDLGIDVDFYIPNRFSEGYGLNIDAIKRIKERGVELIITGDCGTNSHEEVELANRLVIDIIITDHHESFPPSPKAYAVLNPKQENCPYPFKNLAGVGVAFKLLVAIRSELRKNGFWIKRLPNLKKYLDMVSLGTISDMVPLIDENHNLVKHGLKVITNSLNIGIESLKEISGIYGRDIGVSEIGFKLAPRINSVGRLGNASIGVELLTTEHKDRAIEVSQILDKQNRERRSIQENIFMEAKDIVEYSLPSIIDEDILILSSPDWHQGVIGIVASKLAEKYNRPAILISIDGESGKGSARSINFFNIYEALSECRDMLLNFGGHKYAAGFTLEKKNINRLRERLKEIFDKKINKNKLTPKMIIDAEIPFKELSIELVNNIEILGPFGFSNPEPIFSAHGLEILGKPRLMGARENHLKMKLKQGPYVYNSIGFNMSDKTDEINGALIDIAFIPELHQWNGSETIRLNLKDIKINQYDY